MAMDLVDIRVILSGGKEVAAEADAASESIANTGKAAKAANEESAASAKKASGAIKKSAGSTVSSLKKTTSAMKTVGGSLTKYVTAPIVGIGAASVVMGLNFERSVQLLHTQAGIAKREIPGLEKYLLHVSRVTTASPDEASGAAFRLAGAGLKGRRLKEATLASSQLAMVGNADPEETAKTLAQVWYSGIPGAKNFQHVVAEINATVGAGDLRLSQLVDGLGTGVVTSAKLAGLNLHELNSVMAVFGDSTNNVSGYSAQFATALHYFTAPGEKAIGALEELHLGAYQLSEDLAKPNGLVVMLKTLKSHLEALPGGMSGSRGKALLGEILPGGRGRIFLTLLNSIDKIEEKQKRIRTGAADWKEILEETAKNPLVALKNAWSNIEADLVELGQVLIPIIIPALMHLAGYVQDAAHWFKALSPTMKKVVLGIAVFAAILGPALILLSFFIDGIIALGVVMDAVLSPIILIPVLILALAAAFYLAYHKVKWFHDAVDAVVGWVKTHWQLLIIPILPVIWPFILIARHASAVKEAIEWVIQAAENVYNWFKKTGLGQAIGQQFEDAWKAIKKLVPAMEAALEVAETFAEIVTGTKVGGGAQFGPHQEQALKRHQRLKHAAHPGPAPGITGEGMTAGPGVTKALHLHEGRVQTSTSTGTVPMTGPAERGNNPIHVKVVMPNGKVLAEEVKKAENDAGARNNG